MDQFYIVNWLEEELQACSLQHFGWTNSTIQDAILRKTRGSLLPWQMWESQLWSDKFVIFPVILEGMIELWQYLPSLIHLMLKKLHNSIKSCFHYHKIT